MDPLCRRREGRWASPRWWCWWGGGGDWGRPLWQGRGVAGREGGCEAADIHEDAKCFLFFLFSPLLLFSPRRGGDTLLVCRETEAAGKERFFVCVCVCV